MRLPLRGVLSTFLASFETSLPEFASLRQQVIVPSEERERETETVLKHLFTVTLSANEPPIPPPLFDCFVEGGEEESFLGLEQVREFFCANCFAELKDKEFQTDSLEILFQDVDSVPLKLGEVLVGVQAHEDDTEALEERERRSLG